MDADTIKIELIEWITKLNDPNSLGKILALKKQLSSWKKKQEPMIFGSGKHLVEYMADDFNDPLDIFKEYQK